MPIPPGAFSRVSGPLESRRDVSVSVRRIIDGGSALVSCNGMPLFLRRATADLATGQSLTLKKPVKVVGTKTYDAGTGTGPITAFELAFFVDAP
jgi:hypothetical protein